MKNKYDIEEEINDLKRQSSKLQKEINEMVQQQRENNSFNINLECDYIKGRDVRIMVLQAKIKALEWVLSI